MNFSEFYKTNYSGLLQVACRYLKLEDAEDVVQDIMSMIWEKRDAFGFVDSLSAYAFTSVRNKCLDHVKHLSYRREYCRRTMSALRLDAKMMLVSNHSVVMAEYEATELQSRITRAVGNLPQRCRQIFNMSRMEGMKYAEISDRLGISVNTVDCQITLALKRLRRELKVS